LVVERSTKLRFQVLVGIELDGIPGQADELVPGVAWERAGLFLVDLAPA
jgi:hypothetical protein